MEGKIIPKEKALPNVLQWLVSTFEVDHGSALPKRQVYSDYTDFCRTHRLEATNAPAFGKILRMVFPDITSRRLGRRGHTSHHYNHFRRKANPGNPTNPSQITISSREALAALGWDTRDQSHEDQRSRPTTQLQSEESVQAMLVSNPRAHLQGVHHLSQFDVSPHKPKSRGNLTPKSPQPFGGTSFSSPLQVPTYVADELRRVGSVDSFSIAGAHGEAFSPCESGLPSTSPGASFGSFSFSGMLELCDPNDVPHFTILTQQLPFPELHQDAAMFALQYREHFGQLFAALARPLDMDTFCNCLYLFWPQTKKYHRLLSSQCVIDQILQIDSMMYSYMLSLILPDLFEDLQEETLSRTITLSQSYTSWLRGAMSFSVPFTLYECKLKLAFNFGRALLERVHIARLSSQVRVVIENDGKRLPGASMLDAWNRLELDLIEHRAVAFEPIYSINTIFKESFPVLLSQHAGLQPWSKWLLNVASNLVNSTYATSTPSCPLFGSTTSDFMLKWNMYSNMVMANLCLRESDNLNSVLILFTWIQAILTLYVDEHESMKRKNAKLRTLPSHQQQHQTSTCNSAVSSHGGQSTLDMGEIFPMRDNRTGSAAISNSVLANAISTYEGHIPRDIKGNITVGGRASEGHHGRGVDRNSSDSTLSLHLQHLERANGFKNSQAAVYGHQQQQPHYQQQQSRFQHHAVTVSALEPSYTQANRNEAGGRSKHRGSLSSGPTLHASRNQDQFADF